MIILEYGQRDLPSLVIAMSVRPRKFFVTPITLPKFPNGLSWEVP